jgi:hypothetical protein
VSLHGQVFLHPLLSLWFHLRTRFIVPASVKTILTICPTTCVIPCDKYPMGLSEARLLVSQSCHYHGTMQVCCNRVNLEVVRMQ